MKKLTFSLLLITASLLVLAIATTLSLAYRKQDQPPTRPDSLPPGNWGLSSGIYSRGEPENMPVVVMSVTTDASKGLTSNKVEVQNNGDKTVEAVKFKWILYKSDEPDKILLKGESPVIGLVLRPGEKLPIMYPIVSFAKIHKPLLRQGLLYGNYSIEITVGEVLFEGGSTWEWDGIPQLTSLSLPHAQIQKASGQNECCSRETCHWQDGMSPPRYTCISTIASTYCAPSGLSQCTIARCPSTWKYCDVQPPIPFD